MSSGRSPALLTLVATVALLVAPTGAEAGTATSLPPPIPTVTLEPSTTTVTVPPASPAPSRPSDPPATGANGAGGADGAADAGPSSGWTGVAGVALALAAASTILTWRRQRAAG